MRPNLFLTTMLIGVGLMLAAGCGQTDYPATLNATLQEVDEIRNSSTLEPQEMRDALAAFGIDAVTVNGLLWKVRLANQFGGDLASAYDKVVNDQLAEMTPDEVQFYGDATDEVTLDDAEAQAIADFFRDDSIDSLTELEDFLDDTANELPTGVDEENLRAVFIDTSTDDVRDQL
jgi:hypothetical protein